MNIHSLPKIIDNGQLSPPVRLYCKSLSLPQLSPATLSWLRLRRNRLWKTRLLTSVIVSQLHDNERHLLILPTVPPTAHQFLQQVSVWSRITCIRLPLIPHHAIDAVRSQGMHHRIIERCRQILQRHIATGTRRHLRTRVALPRLAQPYHILRHGILRVAIITKGNHIRFLRDEVSRTLFIDHPHRYHIIPLPQQALRNIIAPGRILIVSPPYLPSVQISNVLIVESAQQQPRRPARMSRVDLYVLTKPYAADTPPRPVPLVDGHPFPIRIRRLPVVFRTVRLLQQFIPSVIRLRISLHLSLYEMIVLIEGHPLYQHRIIPLQRVPRNPSLYGRPSPTVNDDALRHTSFFRHPFAKEIAHSRKSPAVPFVQPLPVDTRWPYIPFRPMRIRIILYAKQPDPGILITVYLRRILRINTLYRHIHVRLSRAKPHITHHHIRKQNPILSLPFYFHAVRPSSLHRRKINPPVPFSVSSCCKLLLAEQYGHFFMSIRLTPNRNGFMPLQHHARLEQLWQT